MNNNPNPFDFSDAGEQQGFEVIPDNTVVAVHLTVRPGGAGPDGWLRRANTEKGVSEGLDCMYTVTEGDHAKRKIFGLFTLSGTGPTHAEAGERSKAALGAILRSARGVKYADESDAAVRAQQVTGYQDFDGLRFLVRVGVKPPQNGYSAKNFVKEIVTPDQPGWRQVEQVQAASRPTPSAQQPAGGTIRPAKMGRVIHGRAIATGGRVAGKGDRDSDRRGPQGCFGRQGLHEHADRAAERP
jgi:hypothetical protein